MFRITCAQTLYALRVLRAHGLDLCDNALQIIFRAVIVAKLMYGSSAWWGFTSAMDRQKVKAFIRRSIRAGFSERFYHPENLSNSVKKIVK